MWPHPFRAYLPGIPKKKGCAAATGLEKPIFVHTRKSIIKYGKLSPGKK